MTAPQPTTGTTSEARARQWRSTLTALGMLPVLVLLAIGFHLISGRFLSFGNLSIVLQQASINIVLAAGMTFVVLTGGIDLSVGSILAAAAMVGAIVSLVPDYGMLGIPAAIGVPKASSGRTRVTARRPPDQRTACFWRSYLCRASSVVMRNSPAFSQCTPRSPRRRGSAASGRPCTTAR